MNKTIAISLSPNTFFEDVFCALKTIGKPWEYNKNDAIVALEMWFKQFFSRNYAFSYASGRAGLYEILSGYEIGKGDEVILQAFTCVALPNAILAVGATPIYVDISENLTLDPLDMEKKITPKTKAIIVQHTFGIPSEIEKICVTAKKMHIPVIEDCAHGIGVVYNKRILGQFGDVAFFSFGRDKAFSSVCGGMVITNDTRLGEKMQRSYKNISLASRVWTMQQLFHPIAFSLILPFYDFFSLGKVLLVVLQKLGMLSLPVTGTEKKGIYKKSDVKQLPGALAKLAIQQLHRLTVFNQKREEIASIYIQEFAAFSKTPSTKTIPYLRFPLLFEKRDEIMRALRKEHIYLGKWYGNIIDPVGVDFAKIGYQSESCPNAERIAKKILNLPTLPRMREEDARRISRLLKQYAAT